MKDHQPPEQPQPKRRTRWTDFRLWQPPRTPCQSTRKATTAAVRTLFLTACAAFIASAAHGQIVEPPKTWMFCAGCHAGGPASLGPPLVGVVGRKSGSVPGFNYSKAMKNANVVWNEESLVAFLSDPQKTVPGNRMPFAGISDPSDVAQLVNYLKALQ